MKIAIGRYVQYGFKFWNGREQFYIAEGLQIGILRFRTSKMIFEIDEAERIADLIKGTGNHRC